MALMATGSGSVASAPSRRPRHSEQPDGRERHEPQRRLEPGAGPGPRALPPSPAARSSMLGDVPDQRGRARRAGGGPPRRCRRAGSGRSRGSGRRRAASGAPTGTDDEPDLAAEAALGAGVLDRGLDIDLEAAEQSVRAVGRQRVGQVDGGTGREAESPGGARRRLHEDRCPERLAWASRKALVLPSSSVE